MGLSVCKQMYLCTERGPGSQGHGSQGPQWTLPADLRQGTWILWIWFLQKDPMLLNLSIKKGSSGKGWMSCVSVSSGDFSPADKITSVIWKLWCFKLVTQFQIFWMAITTVEDLLSYKDQQAHLPPGKAGLIKFSLADLRNGEDDLWIQGDLVSLPGRAAVGSVCVPSQLVGSSPCGSRCFLES